MDKQLNRTKKSSKHSWKYVIFTTMKWDINELAWISKMYFMITDNILLLMTENIFWDKGHHSWCINDR